MNDEERNNENIDKSSSIDEFMLPGFRFHPTDEELVGFYLRRKVQHKPLSIEIIKQIDIYKYDPWDLPKLATIGEKEWYFYCPRDRKYRNSVRPNRVTGGGFWKATGTDRPIYAEGSTCIGLKKSLVFYKGRAAKGTKTDWMMHEFRLPSLADHSFSAKKYLDKTNIPENEAWAICKIFRKACSSTRRSLSNSWISPAFDNDTLINPSAANNFNFISSNTTMASINFPDDIEQQSSIITSFSNMQYYPPPMKPYHHSLQNRPFQESSTEQTSSKCAINDGSSLLSDMSSSMFGGFVEDFSNMSENHFCQAEVVMKDQNVGELGDFSYSSFPLMSLVDLWKPNLLQDSSPCPRELSTSYSTNKGCI